MNQKAVTFQDAVEIFGITDIENFKAEDLERLRKKARKRWHPDRISYMNSEETLNQYKHNFQLIDYAIAYISDYLSEIHQHDASPHDEPDDEPEEIRRRPEKVVKYRLRSKPLIISDEDAQKIFKLNDKWRPLQYVQNNFEDNGDGTITDHATGLMWQKSGSENHKRYVEAREYADNLNRHQFAGYRNWRIPTIEELMSLINPRKMSGDLFTDPLFDRKIKCVSSDERLSSDWVFCVYFYNGEVCWNELSSYARVVRSCY